MNRENIEGCKFGLWSVESRLEKGYADCTCECGTRSSVHLSSLRSGTSKSCGCKTGKMISDSKVRHGGSKRSGYTPEYNSWRMMKERCLNVNHQYYYNYGGRGISICPEWMDFSVFLKDMGGRPKGKSLDRIESDGNYEPSNCKWSTRSEQNRGRRPYTHKKKRGYQSK